MKLVETHCHLEMLKEFSLEDILNKTKIAGVEKIITIAAEPETLDAPFDLASKYETIFCTQGVHPHDVKNLSPDHLKCIEERASHKKVVAIGEIGLDYYYDHSPRKRQQEMFEAQLHIACKANLPVVIHSRDAEDDTISILKNFSTQLKRKGVIHSFTSKPSLLDFALKEDFFIGFNGIITFKSAENVREALVATPLNRILTETDAPFLTPVPHRGKENGPYYLNFVLEKMAEVKNESKEHLAAIFWDNAHQLFLL